MSISVYSITDRRRKVSLNTKTANRDLAGVSTIQVATALGGKECLTQILERINHFTAHLGVSVEIVWFYRGILLIQADGIPQGLAWHWAWIISRIAGRQRLSKREIQEMTQDSKIRQQFCEQFCPSTCDNGTFLADKNKLEYYLNDADYMRYIHPIFAQAGLYKPTSGLNA